MNNSFKYWKTIVIIILLLTVILLLPFFINIKSAVFIDYLSDNRDGFNNTIMRSIFFAITSTFINILLGFSGAICLKKISLFSIKGVSLSILLIPFLLGSVSIAFLFKIIFFKTSLFFSSVNDGHQVKHFLLLISIQFWQFGSLFLYLFWLNLKNIPKEIEEYALAAKFSFFAKLKNILIPHSKSLIILLSIFSFIFSFYENAKSQFIFKASQGTNTELISSWLYRTYQSKLLVNPEYAINETFSMSVFLIILIAMVLFICIITLNFFIKRFTNFQKHPKKQFKSWVSLTYFRNNAYNYLFVLLVLIIFAPIILICLNLQIKVSGDILRLFFPLLITFVASVLATVISIIFGISSRIGWKEKLNSFNNYSITFYLVLFLLFLIPSISILISGFKWMSFFGYSTNFSIYLVWIIGHSILLLPLLASFVLTAHFKISNQELLFINSFSIKRLEIARFSFLSRFKLEYILTLIIAYSFIWNESTINKVFSDRIPSFASNLEMLFIGRGADYSLAFSYFLVSILLAAIGISIWIAIINRNKKLN